MSLCLVLRQDQQNKGDCQLPILLQPSVSFFFLSLPLHLHNTIRLIYQISYPIIPTYLQSKPPTTRRSKVTRARIRLKSIAPVDRRRSHDPSSEFGSPYTAIANSYWTLIRLYYYHKLAITVLLGLLEPQLSLTSAMASAGLLDPTKAGKYPVILSDALLGKESSEAYTGVRCKQLSIQSARGYSPTRTQLTK